MLACWQCHFLHCDKLLPMSFLQYLRNARLLARWVLACFALVTGVAIASPFLKPQGMEMVCSGAGVMKLMVAGTDEPATNAQQHTLDCPLCSAVHAPPPVQRQALVPVHPLAHRLQSIPAAQIAALTAAPLPARGPPAFS